MVMMLLTKAWCLSGAKTGTPGSLLIVDPVWVFFLAMSTNLQVGYSICDFGLCFCAVELARPALPMLRLMA